MPTPFSNEFAKTYGRFLPPVRAKCRRMLGRTAVAEEVAQEAFTRLWQGGPRLDAEPDTRKVMSWLYVTATRLAIDVLREGRGTVAIEDLPGEPLPCGGPRPDDLAAARAMIVALRRTAAPEEIEAAILTRVDGLSQPETAALLGVSERTIRRLLDRFDGHTARLREEHADRERVG